MSNTETVTFKAFSPSDKSLVELFTQLKQQIYKRPSQPEVIDPVATCIVALDGKDPVATLTIYKKNNLGLIGHFEALCADAGISLLKEAERTLWNAGVEEIIGPMNGDTWHRYRLATDEINPYFLGEPQNPTAYHDYFVAAGFSPAAKYESRITTNLLKRREAYLRLDARLVKAGITTKSIDIAQFEDQLHAIYAMSLPAFADNLYYEPISFVELCSLYEKMKPLLDPDYIQLARDRDGRLVGFAFAYPDLYDPQRIIFKTLAAAERARKSGLGVYLFDRIHTIAAEKGKEAVIHALMHSDNNSLKLSNAMQSTLFRSYVLYGKRRFLKNFDRA